MSTDPTAENIDAVAEVLVDAVRSYMGVPGVDVVWNYSIVKAAQIEAEAILTVIDPDAQAALAASLPAEVMLAALVDRGTLERITARVMFGEPVCEFYRSTEWREVAP